MINMYRPITWSRHSYLKRSRPMSPPFHETPVPRDGDLFKRRIVSETTFFPIHQISFDKPRNRQDLHVAWKNLSFIRDSPEAHNISNRAHLCNIFASGHSENVKFRICRKKFKSSFWRFMYVKCEIKSVKISNERNLAFINICQTMYKVHKFWQFQSIIREILLPVGGGSRVPSIMF